MSLELEGQQVEEGSSVPVPTVEQIPGGPEKDVDMDQDQQVPVDQPNDNPSTDPIQSSPNPTTPTSVAPPPPTDTVPVPEPTTSEATMNPSSSESTAISQSVSSGSVKRSNPDDDGEDEERYAKRAREEGNVNGVTEPTATSTPSQPQPAPAQPISTATDPSSAAPAPQPPAQPLAPGQPAPYIPGTYKPQRPPPYPSHPIDKKNHAVLLRIVQNLKKQNGAYAFTIPVDPVALNIPHYPNIITKPRDLGTIESKLYASDPNPNANHPATKKALWKPELGFYTDVQEVVEDLRQIWENCKVFNGPDHAITKQAVHLEAQLEKMLEKNVLIPPAPPAQNGKAPTPPTTEAKSRRMSTTQPPPLRRNTSEDPSSRPKREIHPPAPYDSSWQESDANQQRRSTVKLDPDLQWARKQLNELVTKTPTAQMVGPFAQPVPKEFTEYHKVIKHPMDLGTIREKLDTGFYLNAEGVDADMKLMFKNCFQFNFPGEPVYDFGKALEAEWLKRWSTRPVTMVDVDADGITHNRERLLEIRKQIKELQAQEAAILAENSARKANPPAAPARQQTSSTSQRKPSPQQNGGGHHAGPKAKKPKQSKPSQSSKMDVVDDGPRSLTIDEKSELAEKMMLVDEAIMTKAMDIISQTTQIDSASGEVELEVDSLPPQTQIMLYDLVVGKKSKPKAKAPKKAGAGGGGGGGPRKAQGGRGIGKQHNFLDSAHISNMANPMEGENYDDQGSDDDGSYFSD